MTTETVFKDKHRWISILGTQRTPGSFCFSPESLTSPADPRWVFLPPAPESTLSILQLLSNGLRTFSRHNTTFAPFFKPTHEHPAPQPPPSPTAHPLATASAAPELGSETEDEEYPAEDKGCGEADALRLFLGWGV
ncbi:MAG: hypothetical protein Q9207_005252 [Kuettlingeria erythrocarpa]